MSDVDIDTQVGRLQNSFVFYTYQLAEYDVEDLPGLHDEHSDDPAGALLPPLQAVHTIALE